MKQSWLLIGLPENKTADNADMRNSHQTLSLVRGQVLGTRLFYTLTLD